MAPRLFSRQALCALCAILLIGVSAGCRSAAPAPREGIETLDALVWFQTAEENRQLQRSVFAAATRALAAALADPSWRALDQDPEAVALPPAVIVDVDETMLDNSPFEVERLRSGAEFTEEGWAIWVERAEARPIPGAVEFVRFAEERGVTIFYVTNRDAEFEEATRRNLVEAGFSLSEQTDVVLLRGERSDWSSDKQGRRDLVAASHRVLLVLGDDLGDFLSGVRDATVEERERIAAAHAERFGTQWFVLPNPLYGSWERAIDAGGGPHLDRLRRLERRLALLRGYE